jgi:uncharacterized Zn finger protein (UPF0148 family)
MPKPPIELRYCFKCGMVRVELADFTDCPVCKEPTRWTQIEAYTTPRQQNQQVQTSFVAVIDA